MILMSLLDRFKQKQETRNEDDGEFTPRSEEAQEVAAGRKERARRSRSQDPLLPEKKKARRRLIGAIALTLAAVIILPMIFDAEPKQLADDIDIRIPTKDKVPEQGQDNTETSAQVAKNNRAAALREEIVDPASLTPAPVKPAAPANNAAAKPAQTTPTTTAALANLSPKPAKPETKPEIKTELKVEAKPEPKAPKNETKPEVRNEVKTVKANDKPADKTTLAKVEEKSSNKPIDKVQDKTPDKAQEKFIDKSVFDKPAKPTVNRDADAERALAILEGRNPAAKPATEKSEHSRYVIQVAALANQEKVDELRAKLQAANLKSYTQKVAAEGGEKIRVRLGPYSSKEEAEQAKAKLAKLGLSGSLVPN